MTELAAIPSGPNVDETGATGQAVTVTDVLPPKRPPAVKADASVVVLLAFTVAVEAAVVTFCPSAVENVEVIEAIVSFGVIQYGADISNVI